MIRPAPAPTAGARMGWRDCDSHQVLCFALALSNGADPILKERLFGLTNSEGNHGEDVKEYYFYLDSTPTHSYMKYLYKYPQAAYPYDDLVATNRQRSRHKLEYELIDTGIFDDNRYFDVVVEYAKAAPEDVLIRISIHNRGPEAALLHVLPTLWFRNTWSWPDGGAKPVLQAVEGVVGHGVIHAHHTDSLLQESLNDYDLYCEGQVPYSVTENETIDHHRGLRPSLDLLRAPRLVRSRCWKAFCQDDSWFAFIAAADENDDWTDPAVWRKANPSFGLSVKEDDLARKAEKAIALPGAQNAFRRMHLNEWTEQAERWIDMAAWDACAGPVSLELLARAPVLWRARSFDHHRRHRAGLGVPARGDDDLWRVLSRYFVPAEICGSAPSATVCPPTCWSAQGFIEATPGNVVDYAAIERRILDDSASSRLVRSPTTRGTRRTSRCACRRRARP